MENYLYSKYCEAYTNNQQDLTLVETYQQRQQQQVGNGTLQIPYGKGPFYASDQSFNGLTFNNSSTSFLSGNTSTFSSIGRTYHRDCVYDTVEKLAKGTSIGLKRASFSLLVAGVSISS